MTERPSPSVEREATRFSIGPSAVEWNGTELTITIDERAAPLPRRVRGRITVKTEGICGQTFLIDDAGRHRWSPLAPYSRVEVEFQQPDLRWNGHGYFDTNAGDEPLEDAFAFWDWSRTILDGDKTAILYNTDMLSGASCLSALMVDRAANIEEIDEPPSVDLPPTRIFRVPRRTRSEAGSTASIIKTLEDVPFYSRSLIESQLFGSRRQGIHESLCGPRLNWRMTQFMLPFRMPRRRG